MELTKQLEQQTTGTAGTVDPTSGPMDVEPTRPPIMKIKPDKPSPFNGKGNRPDTWLFQVEQYFLAHGQKPQGKEAVDFAATLLKDGAATWWQYINDLVSSASMPPISNWTDFRKAVLEEFQNLDVEKQARDRLDRLTQ